MLDEMTSVSSSLHTLHDATADMFTDYYLQHTACTTTLLMMTIYDL